ncbi:hypothetical protein [Brevibacterium sp. RIT 803]|uniref:hypothetical protein n=1 Tax=Brevibacterium sp. RIT 803 TaxID=2810210 RepID=UPI00194E1D5A|nr:hypothetical protein [Brevibacterium sp. RIT 803]MBM6588763.1 hypothetical protein [Brevibacterium sp. RIT 803]
MDDEERHMVRAQITVEIEVTDLEKLRSYSPHTLRVTDDETAAAVLASIAAEAWTGAGERVGLGRGVGMKVRSVPRDDD